MVDPTPAAPQARPARTVFSFIGEAVAFILGLITIIVLGAVIISWISGRPVSMFGYSVTVSTPHGSGDSAAPSGWPMHRKHPL